MSFAAEVAKRFDFLVRDHGFAWIDRSEFKVGELATYRKDPIELSIGWYKGEVDLSFSIALDFAASHRVFRPYLSRTFGLHEIATRQDPAAYAELAARMRPLGFVTTLDIAAVYLEEAAKIVKRFAAPILGGDLGLLEKITLARQGKAA
ncbi:MAG TPA: hypothetical protein VFB36_01070 [Nevskiaceae bacterium]|nr:hypothetical protein [Nevskiaceae bacterium]